MISPDRFSIATVLDEAADMLRQGLVRSHGVYGVAELEAEAIRQAVQRLGDLGQLPAHVMTLLGWRDERPRGAFIRLVIERYASLLLDGHCIYHEAGDPNAEDQPRDWALTAAANLGSAAHSIRHPRAGSAWRKFDPLKEKAAA